MKARKPSRQVLLSSCADVGPEDGQDPRVFFRKPSGGVKNRKALQLCGQLVNCCPTMDAKWYAGSQVIDEVRGKGCLDFVDAIARKLPMRMLGKMLGIPDEDGPWLVKQGDALIGNADPEFTTHPVGLVDTDPYRLMPFRSPVSGTLFAYAEEQARIRRNAPRDDVNRRCKRTRRHDRPAVGGTGQRDLLASDRHAAEKVLEGRGSGFLRAGGPGADLSCKAGRCPPRKRREHHCERRRRQRHADKMSSWHVSA